MSEERKSEELLKLEEAARDIGNTLRAICPPGMRFALLMFTEGEGGFTTYVANVQRPQMIEALKEAIVMLEANVVAPHGQPEHPANKRGQG
jgi:hypothetical protein